MTIAMLLENTLKLAELQTEKKNDKRNKKNSPL